jgi:enoyl-CoA hydratase/carnithine racemase
MKLQNAIDLLLELAGPGDRRKGTVDLELSEGVAHLMIVNQEARNAMHIHMMVDLGHCVMKLKRADVGLVYLHAEAGGAFCSGGHLGDVRTSLASPDNGKKMALAMSTILNGLLDLPALVVAVIEGPAIGGGAELATAADIRLILPGGYLHFVQATLGVVSGWGGCGRLIAHCGAARATRILLGKERLYAEEAEALGIGISVDDLSLREWQEHLASIDVDVLRALKMQIGCGRRVSDEQREQLEAEYFSGVWAGSAHRRALAKLPI